MNYYTGNIIPEENTIFVFGSNTEGRHGKGAAKVALNQFNAQYGNPKGIQGNSYAIITKDLSKGYRSIDKSLIKEQIKELYEYAILNPNLKFKIAYRNTTNKTLSGYTGIEMVKLFLSFNVPDNIYFSEEWKDLINEIRNNTL